MDKLTEIVAEMRRLGVTRLKTPEMEVDLGPEQRPPPQPVQVEERDTEAEAVATEEKEWNERWRKLLRSSGSPIPPFPKKRPTVVRTT